jgi:hypothetical protein
VFLAMTSQHLTRTVQLDDVTIDEAWRLIGSADGWSQWMVDEATIDVAAGAVGTVDDQGSRRVLITRVDEGRSVEFVWTDPLDGSQSVVELSVDPASPSRDLDRALGAVGCVITIRERRLDGQPVVATVDATRADAWERRVLCLWAVCVVAALVPV